jgi:hypothetical protein
MAKKPEERPVDAHQVERGARRARAARGRRGAGRVRLRRHQRSRHAAPTLPPTTLERWAATCTALFEAMIQPRIPARRRAPRALGHHARRDPSDARAQRARASVQNAASSEQRKLDQIDQAGARRRASASVTRCSTLAPRKNAGLQRPKNPRFERAAAEGGPMLKHPRPSACGTRPGPPTTASLQVVNRLFLGLRHRPTSVMRSTSVRSRTNSKRASRIVTTDVPRMPLTTTRNGPSGPSVQ